MDHPTHLQSKPDPEQFCQVGGFECPCCSFTTEEKFSFTLHLENHISHAVEHGGYFILKCNKLCRTTAHFHCLYCSQTVIRKDQYIRHVSQCLKTEEFATPPPSPSVAAFPTPPPATSVSKPPVSTPLSSDPSTFASPPIPLPQIRKKRETVMCPHCELTLNRRNIKLHILRRHRPKEMDITTQNHFKSQCVDFTNGVYAVEKSFSTSSTPIHVIKKTWGSEHRTSCELDICRINTEFAERSNSRSYECHHLQSLAYCEPAERDIPLLTEQVLQTMVDDLWFGEDKKERCLAQQRKAINAGAPLSCLVTVCGPSYKKYISVFEPTISSYSRLGRVIVIYDAKTISWHCPCARPRQSCLHKYVAKWHLFEVDRELSGKTRSVEEDSITQHIPTDVEGFEEEEGIQYPPEEQNLSQMVKYIYEKKKLPAVITSDVVNTTNFPLSFTPSEAFCTECSEVTPLSDPVIITSKARIVTMTNVIEGISMYRKECYRCGMVYRYQEWSDGIHNFDDHILLSIHLCHFLRNSLQTHQAVDSAIEVLERTSGKAFPSKKRILQAYLSFEALSDHTYTCSCLTCGYHPVSVVKDLHKKGVFSMPVSSIEEPPEDFDGHVNAENFWKLVSLEIISCGLVPMFDHKTVMDSAVYMEELCDYEETESPSPSPSPSSVDPNTFYMSLKTPRYNPPRPQDTFSTVQGSVLSQIDDFEETISPRDPYTFTKPYTFCESPRPESDFKVKGTSSFSQKDNNKVLHKEKMYHNNPPRPQAAFSPPLPRIDDVIKFLCKISENTQIEVAVKKSRSGAAVAGGGAFLGGLLGGPPGIFIGGTLGSAVGWWMTRGQFRPLHQIIMEMSLEQKEKLYSEIINNLGWDNVSELILSVMSNPSLKKKVLAILESFAKEQLRAKVKYGKK